MPYDDIINNIYLQAIYAPPPRPPSRHSNPFFKVTIHAYSDGICRHLFDSIPKQVHGFLVKGICDNFVPWMLNKVDESEMQRLLAEDPLSQRKRRELESKLSQFEQALVILKSAGRG